MLLQLGAKPHPEYSVSRRLLLLAGLAALSFVHTVAAQQALPLTLVEAERLALEYEPGRAALLARADALADEAVAAGALPDPTLRVGLANYPIESGGFTTEGMTQGQLAFRQSMPPGDSRELSTLKFQSLADEMMQSADARARDVLTSVRTAWLDAYYWQRAHAIVSDSRSNFEDLVIVARSLYSVGKKDQQDVLRAELELSRLDDRLITIERQQAEAEAALAQWIGGAAARRIADPLPAWRHIPGLQALKENLDRHPAVLAADARIGARDAGVSLAEERYKPGWAIDLGYGYRDGMLPDGSPRSDFVSLSVTVDMPFFRKNRQDRKFAAARSEHRAAQEAREELRRRLESRLDAEVARHSALTRRAELYEQRILVQVEDQVNAALSAYRSDAGDFADVMRSVIDELNARLDHVRLNTEQAKSYALLANLGGLDR